MVNQLGSARASSVSEDILMIASGTTSVPPLEQTSSPPAPWCLSWWPWGMSVGMVGALIVGGWKGEA